MAYLAQYQLSPCPYCGKDAVYYSDRDGETYFYIATCEDRECQGHNELMFDDRDACCNWWNNMCQDVKDELKAQGSSETEDEGLDTSGLVVTGITPINGENSSLVSSIEAIGTNLDEAATYVWTVFFNSTVVSDSSIGPTLHLTPSQASLYNVASTVRVTVMIGDYTSDTFTLKA